MNQDGEHTYTLTLTEEEHGALIYALEDMPEVYLQEEDEPDVVRYGEVLLGILRRVRAETAGR
jgi:hypothetical protein